MKMLSHLCSRSITLLKIPFCQILQKKNGSLLKKSYEFGKVNSKSKLTSLKKSSIVSTLRIHEVLSLMFLREEF